MANLRGRTATMGKRKKQMTKHTAAPRLQPEKMRMRSHLLTRKGVSSEESEGVVGGWEAMRIGGENGEMGERQRVGKGE